MLKQILVIDIPSEGFLKDLATNQKLKTLLEKTKSTGVEVMIHFTPNSVFKTARYQNFIELVNAKRHLTLNDQNKYVKFTKLNNFWKQNCSQFQLSIFRYSALKKVHHLQTKLNKIDPKLHPLLRFVVRIFIIHPTDIQFSHIQLNLNFQYEIRC